MQFCKLLEGLKDIDSGFKIPDAMFSFAIPSFLGVQAGQALNDLTVFIEEFYNFDLPQKEDIVKSLKKIGSPIDEEGLSYRTRAGWLNANPAVICVPDLQDFNGKGNCRVAAFAREGLINQKTAFKAVKRFEKSLQEIGAKFSSKTVVPLIRLDSTVLEPE